MGTTRLVQHATLTAASYDDSRQRFCGAVYDHANRVVGGCLRNATMAWKHDDPAVLFATPDPAIRLATGLYLGRFMFHFGHFIIETLPALAYADQTDQPLLFHPFLSDAPASEAAASFRGYFFNALGVDPSRIQFATATTAVDSLTVPDELPDIIGGNVDRASLATYARVRDQAVSRVGRSTIPTAVYLSRSGYAEGRDIEDEHEAAYRVRGYTIVRPHELPIEEQIALVAGADAVAGVHGSALHLCCFMRPGGTVTILPDGRPPVRALLAVNDALGLTTVLA